MPNLKYELFTIWHIPKVSSWVNTLFALFKYTFEYSYMYEYTFFVWLPNKNKTSKYICTIWSFIKNQWEFQLRKIMIDFEKVTINVIMKKCINKYYLFTFYNWFGDTNVLIGKWIVQKNQNFYLEFTWCKWNVWFTLMLYYVRFRITNFFFMLNYLKFF